ncbi:MAG: periplasmic glucans biosynthesis protein [Acidobacteriota bacterium]|nr:periplasmic glucans biosynthesis protein [Acidobacteriota bacterium]
MLTRQKGKPKRRIEMKKVNLFIICELLFLIMIYAGDISVPGDYLNIQDAVNNSSSGDRIIIADGVFNESVYIYNKTDLIISGMGENTILEGDVPGPKFKIEDSKGIQIEKIHIIGGSKQGFYTQRSHAIFSDNTVENISVNHYDEGGAFYANESSIILKNNEIKNCYGGQKGGGGYFQFSDVVLISNKIKNCTAWAGPGGFYISGVNPSGYNKYGVVEISENFFSSNTGDFCGALHVNLSDYNSIVIKKNVFVGCGADFYEEGAMKIDIQNSTTTEIVNNVLTNTIVGTQHNDQAVFIYIANGNLHIANNIFSGDAVSYSKGFNYGIINNTNANPPENVTVEYNDFYRINTQYQGITLGEGNITANPLFNEEVNYDYHLIPGSSCIDAGNSDIKYNDPDGSRNDMGVYGGVYAGDLDEDGFTNSEEISSRTNPLLSDTDNDGVLDGEEVHKYQTNPLVSDSDGDGVNDGEEIELLDNLAPMDPNRKPIYSRYFSFQDLVSEAFFMPYSKPEIEDIPILDQLSFQQKEAISCNNLIDDGITYAYARPRAALDKLKFCVFTSPDSTDPENNMIEYALKTYALAAPNYAGVNPPINKNLIPINGKVLTRFIIGHKSNKRENEYPQLFDFSAAGYIRFNGFPPHEVGSSFRVALHNVAQQDEDFPFFKEIYYNIIDQDQSILMGILDSQAFSGAISFKLIPGNESSMEVHSRFFPRRDILLSNEPYTGFVGFSSMFWKDETDSTNGSGDIANPNDEAHDCDTLIVGYDRNEDGKVDIIKEKRIDNPKDITITDFNNFPGFSSFKQIYFALENRDRTPEHYSKYESAHYEKRCSYSIRLKSCSIPLSLILHEIPTDAEYYDNIVINLAIRANLYKALSVNDAIKIEYVTTAYYPIDSDEDGLTDQLEKLIGTNPFNKDSDCDGIKDYEEMLKGMNPLEHSIIITKPKEYPEWRLGSLQEISWTCSNSTHGFGRIELYQNGSRIGIISRKVLLSTGSYLWLAGSYEGGRASAGTGYSVRVIKQNKICSYESDASFSLTSLPALTLIEPNGSESWPLGKSRLITWSHNGLTGTCQLDLYKDGLKMGNINMNIKLSYGSYNWVVGQYLSGIAAGGSGYTIRIVTTDNLYSDISNNSFTITSAPILTVITPYGGESWITGSSQVITWTSSGLGGLCNLELYKDGIKLGDIGQNVNVSSGLFNWSVGEYIGGNAPIGNDYKVRIVTVSLDGHEPCSGQSNTDFSITI